MKTETKIGVVQPQAKEHLEPPEAGRSSGGFALRSFRGDITCGHLGFALLAPTTRRKYISVTLSYQVAAAAAAKLLQSCLTLCDPTDGSPTGSSVPGILQARTLEWVAIAFSNAWEWKVKVKLLSRVWLLATPWTVAYQAPPSMGFSRQECWSGLPVPSPSHQVSGK